MQRMLSETLRRHTSLLLRQLQSRLSRQRSGFPADMTTRVLTGAYGAKLAHETLDATYATERDTATGAGF